jgi:4-hydroxybenzoate polyprenyltransferase
MPASGGVVIVTAKKLSRQIWLLALLVGMEIINPLLEGATPGERLVSTALFIGVGVAILTAVLRTKRQRYLGATLVGTAIVLEIARNWVAAERQLPMEVMVSTIIGAFFLFVFSVILSELLHTRRVGFNDVVGAFSGYILIALIWGRLYALVWMLVPHSFSISDQPHDSRNRRVRGYHDDRAGLKQPRVARSDVRPVLSRRRRRDHRGDQNLPGARGSG